MNDEAFKRGFIKAARSVGLSFYESIYLYKQAADFSLTGPKFSASAHVGFKPQSSVAPSTPQAAPPVVPKFSIPPLPATNNVNRVDTAGYNTPAPVTPTNQAISSINSVSPTAGNVASKVNEAMHKSYLGKVVSPNNSTLSLPMDQAKEVNEGVGQLPGEAQSMILSKMREAAQHSPQAHIEAGMLGSAGLNKLTQSSGILSRVPGLAATLSKISPLARILGRTSSVANLATGAFNEATDAQPGYFDKHLAAQNADTPLNYAFSALQNSTRPAGSIVNSLREVGGISSLLGGLGKDVLTQNIPNTARLGLNNARNYLAGN